MSKFDVTLNINHDNKTILQNTLLIDLMLYTINYNLKIVH